MGRVPSKWHFHRLLCQKGLPGYFFVQFLCNLLGLNPNAKITSIGTTTLQRTRWLILKWYLVLQFYYCLLATSFQGCANILSTNVKFWNWFHGNNTIAQKWNFSQAMHLNLCAKTSFLCYADLILIRWIQLCWTLWSTTPQQVGAS